MVSLIKISKSDPVEQVRERFARGGALDSLFRIQHNAVAACHGLDGRLLAGKDRHVAQRKMPC
jgi:hypothetical protein